ncbi:uncharacterized protein LOC131597659 [Vicia villosa]|uniref:uncharacterized protein LOC131597659 n=1 Tax=Vicia villosa TaxID=3911 RepID=UPI00273B1CB9|nr:uncharacterized protein LOC131597659 [Vicia villosa]
MRRESCRSFDLSEEEQQGKTFQFARFIDMEDGRLFAVKLDNIMIAERKIHANLPRFQRGSLGGVSGFTTQRGDGGDAKGVKEAEVRSRRDGQASRRGHRSFAEVVGGGLGISVVPGDLSSSLCFKSEDEDKKRFLKAYVGRVLIPRSAYNLQSYLEMEGVYVMRVTSLGGDVCLLEDREAAFIEDLIAEGESWWKSWFSDIKKWEEGMIGESRDVWLRIFGIPAHVWKSNFFVALAEVWGKFICVDERTAKGDVFDVARIMVKINFDLLIPEFFHVNINGKLFKLVVREDALGLFRSSIEPSGIVDSDSSSAETDRIWQDGNGAEDEDLVTQISNDSIQQFSSKGSLNNGGGVQLCDPEVKIKGGTVDSQVSSSIPVANSPADGKDTEFGSFD